jgi:NADH-quinone oxidoreductase subunit C
MRPTEIAQALRTQFPSEVIEVCEFANQTSVVVKRQRILDMLMYLRESFDLDHLQDLCGVDYKDKGDYRFEVVYQLFSVAKGYAIRLRARIPEGDPQIDSITPLWEGANWHERECFDMFGIVFKGHPDLRRILMPEDWQGYPLRKDYPLKGHKDYWHGFKEVLKKAEEIDRG